MATSLASIRRVLDLLEEGIEVLALPPRGALGVQREDLLRAGRLVQLGELAVAAHEHAAVDLVVQRPAHDGPPVLVDRHLALAVVAGHRDERRRVLEAGAELALVLRAPSSNGQSAAISAGAVGALSIRKPQSLLDVGELVRNRGLRLADPALDRLLVHALRRLPRDEGAGACPLPARRYRCAKAAPGDSTAPAATTTVGASTVSLSASRRRPSPSPRRRVARPSSVSDPVRAARRPRTSHLRPMRPGGRSSSWTACSPAGSRCSSSRTRAGRRTRVGVAGDRLPGEAAGLHALDHLAVRPVLRGGLDVHPEPFPDRVDVLLVLELVDPLDARGRPTPCGCARACGRSSCS